MDKLYILLNSSHRSSLCLLWDICYKVITQNSLYLQGTGKESRDFVHALDIARALQNIGIKAPMQGEIYNLGSGKETSILELSTLILKALDSKLIPHFDNVVPSGSPLNWCADLSKLTSLGFTNTVSLTHAVKTYANWCYAELIGI